MGTVVRIAAATHAGLGRQQVQIAVQEAFNEIATLEARLSSWKADSDVGRLNAAAGQPVYVGEDTLAVFRKAQWIGERSGGAFDVTFQIMSELWKFGDAAEVSPTVPSKRDVDRLRRWIDYRRVELDEEHSTLRLPPPMQLSLGGIAKGYIVDRAAQFLKGRGLNAFFVQAGGDLLGVGRKPTGEAWSSGIQDPRGPRGSYFAMLEFSDHAFSTAGDYARAYVVDGRRYHHIIDPRTGFPARLCRSVTVWAEDALTADAMDDAVFVLGPDKGIALIEQTPGVGAVVVDSENRVIVSHRLKSRLKILRPPTDGI